VKASKTRFSTHGPKAKRGTVLTFRLRKAGRVELVIRSVDAGCAVIGRKPVHGSQGLNRVRFKGRVHGRALAPGRYTITVVVIRGETRKRVGVIAVEVVPPGRRLTKAERTAPLAACSVSSSTAGPSAPAVLIAAGSPLAASATGGRAATAKQKRSRPVLGASFVPPRLPSVTNGGDGGGIAWLAVGLYLVLALAGGTILVFVARFVKGTWNP
jgi:hypothetical protein